jgi:hypothetical protein
MFKDLGKTQPSRKVKIGDPVEFGPESSGESQLTPAPTWRARRAGFVADGARDVARRNGGCDRVTVADVPALEGALAIRSAPPPETAC